MFWAVFCCDALDLLDAAFGDSRWGACAFGGIRNVALGSGGCCPADLFVVLLASENGRNGGEFSSSSSASESASNGAFEAE